MAGVRHPGCAEFREQYPNFLTDEEVATMLYERPVEKYLR